jgi:hypothetical protein
VGVSSSRFSFASFAWRQHDVVVNGGHTLSWPRWKDVACGDVSNERTCRGVACLVLLRLCHLVLDGLDFLDRRHLGGSIAAAACPLCALLLLVLLLLVLLLPSRAMLCVVVFADLNAVRSFSCRWSRKTLTEAAAVIGRADLSPGRLPRANSL